jgi:hypothetical protein
MSNPLEVKLVDEVRECRTCQWFWGSTPPYGNFPVYDWNEDFPEAVRNQKQTTDYISQQPAFTGKACGQEQITPGIMHGCRKAPIMTIGINPNMTAYFPGISGGRWSYPFFDKKERYAYYYRWHNVYQESLGDDFIKDNVDRASAIIAEKDGWLLDAERSSDHRWLLLTIKYAGEGEKREIEVAWSDDFRFVILVEEGYPEGENPGFKKGDIIGGKIKGLKKEEVQIYENSVSYYQRYIYVLQDFQKIIGDELPEGCLSIAEDVAQHDMIACASPGWSSKYDIPTERITESCVINHGYIVSQLIQSRPKVIVIVGGSSLEMFAQVFAPFMKDLDYQYETLDSDGNSIIVQKEVYQLLKETTEREKFLHIKIDDFELKTRIVISPHFSYSSNFVEQSRLSELAWQAFTSDFPEDVKILKEEKRIQPNTWNDIVPIRIYGKNDELKQKLSFAAWQVLMAYYYDPLMMLAEVLEQEYRAKRLVYDEEIQHFKRSEGSCQFCVNELWKFPEGCPYGKTSEPSPSEGELEEVVQKVINEGCRY